MFEMSAAEKEAAQDAMNGMLVNNFSHAVLYCIGAIATFWLLMILFGIHQELQMRKIDWGDALGLMALAVFIFIGTGTLIHYQ
jgi:mannitol-specific phosphotransferase system IIBC component